MHTLSIPAPILWRQPKPCTILNWKKESKEDMTANCFVPNKENWNDDGMNLARLRVQDDYLKPEAIEKMEDSIIYVKNMLSSMDDGQVSVSPYDTAWIALIRDLSGLNTPQFPSSLEWIAQNQLSDGSWGDEHFFLVYDRLVNTLACVVALRSWNVHADKSEKGISFIKDNIIKLEDADIEHMTCGFEVIFPALLQRARDLGIHGVIPHNAPVMQGIYATRDQKMKSPTDIPCGYLCPTLGR